MAGFQLGFGLGLTANMGGGGRTNMPPLDGTNPIAAYATDRKLLSSYNGAFLTKSGSQVTELKQQTTSGKADFVTDNGTLSTVAVGSDVALNFTGSESLKGPLLSDLYSGGAAWWFVVAEPLTIDANGNPAGVGGNVPLGDKSEGGDLVFIQNGTASKPGFGLQSVQFANPSYAVTPDVAAYPGNRMVIQFRKDSTKLYARVNLGTEVQVSLGTLTATSAQMMLGASNVASHFFKGREYGAGFYAGSDVPADRDAIVAKIMAYYGIPRIPDLSSFPDATNTGTTGTLAAVSGDVILTTPGQVYADKNVAGKIVVQAANVTIQNCKVSSGDAWGIHIESGVTGCTVQDCEIDGLGTGNTIGIAFEPSAIGGAVLRCNIHHCEDGVRPSSGTPVKYCYIHDFASLNDSGHYDGIEMDGGQDDIEIAHNTIINQTDQTSAVQMNNEFGTVTNINIHDNYLSGGSFTWYIDASKPAGYEVTGIQVRDNVMGQGSNGWAALSGFTASGNLTTSNNFDVLTGQKVDGVF